MRARWRDRKVSVERPEVLEYDILVRINKEDIHILNYLLEAEDHVMNIRSLEGEYLRVIAPKDTVLDAIRLLESAKTVVNLELVELRPNDGNAG
ncbi:hypothetical protein A4H02_06600 [Fervidobacterium thailandense]|uniref:DUF4911 domain-containing protein n=1 Tax=Fervidobacterium thailandense TaxID=1008305 RepID=A0A1E3G1S8_9BACT|nr:hypothetical protein A4H02_06600 [Fervidobacterium thailandense]